MIFDEIGLQFRTGNYERRVKWGKRTIKAGEAAVVWDRRGRAHEIVGPRLVYLFYSTIRFMDQRIATSTQYLRVESTDGTITHHPGPILIYQNPIKHRSVRVCEAIEIPSQHDCVVVTNLDDSSQRQIVGAKVCFPQPNEKIHRFMMSGNSTASYDGINSHGVVFRHIDHEVFPELLHEPTKMIVTLALTMDFEDVLATAAEPDFIANQLLPHISADINAFTTLEQLEINVATSGLEHRHPHHHQLVATSEGGKGVVMMAASSTPLFPRTARLIKEKSIVFTRFSILKMEPSHHLKEERDREANARRQREEAEKEAAMRERLAAAALEHEIKRAEKKEQLADMALDRETMRFEKRQAAVERRIQLEGKRREAERKHFVASRDDFTVMLERLKALEIDPEKVCLELIRRRRDMFSFGGTPSRGKSAVGRKDGRSTRSNRRTKARREGVVDGEGVAATGDDRVEDDEDDEDYFDEEWDD